MSISCLPLLTLWLPERRAAGETSCQWEVTQPCLRCCGPIACFSHLHNSPSLPGTVFLKGLCCQDRCEAGPAGCSISLRPDPSPSRRPQSSSVVCKLSHCCPCGEGALGGVPQTLPIRTLLQPLCLLSSGLAVFS